MGNMMSKLLNTPGTNGDSQNGSDGILADQSNQEALPSSSAAFFEGSAASSSTGGGAGSGGLGGSSSASAGSSTGAAAPQVAGLVFASTFAPGSSQQFINAALAAEQALEQNWITPITIHVYFQEADLGYNSAGNYALAQNAPTGGVVSVTYAQLQSVLLANQFSPYSISLPATDPNPAGGADWTLPESYARMLGLDSNASATPDLTVMLNDNANIKWSYGQDVTNVLVHELTENGMGRLGGLGVQGDAQPYNIWSTMDLFRYASAGVHDYSYGDTAYFSPNGTGLSLGLPFDTASTQGDTADFYAADVLGGGYPGETFGLSQTDMEVMDALGWIPMQQDAWTVSGSGNWTTSADWSVGRGYLPTYQQDAWIGLSGYAATVTSTATELVNSIGVNSISTLVIDGDSTFTASDGTVLNPNNVFASFGNGNQGTIDVGAGSALAIGNAFDNAGALDIGVITANSNANGTGALVLTGTVMLYGGGVVNLGQSNLLGQGSIQTSGGGLVNVDNRIAGVGSIALSLLDNQSGGVIEASYSSGSLLVNAGTFANEGSLIADAHAELFLGLPGGANSLTNSGSITVNGSLQILGAYSISGAGSITMGSVGAKITSGGTATFNNSSTIETTGIGQIGATTSSSNFTFNNTGAVRVSGSAAELTLNTGGNTIGDGGGLLEAMNGGVLLIASNVNTGQASPSGQAVPPGGIIEAASGGLVLINSVTVSDIVASPSVSGEIIIDGGTIGIAPGSAVSVPIIFKNTGGTLIVYAASATLGGSIFGFALGDKIDLPYVSYAAGEHMVFQSISNGMQTYALENASNGLLATLDFSGHYSAALFQVQQDSFAPAGSIISLQAPATAAANDYNQDGVSDLLWRNQTTGDLYEWSMSNGQPAVSNIYLGQVSGWNEVGTGDFFGAGTSDLLWQSQATGDVYEWTMSNGLHTGTADSYLGNLSGWTEIGVGDFYGAGTSDLLWQNQSTGDVYEWQMSNGQHTGNDVYLGALPNWKEVGVGDFFGVGTDDLLWQNQTTGDVYEWQMSNGQHTGNDVYLGRLSGWSEVGAGDFTGNGTSDLLWQNQTTGDVYEWMMSNGQHVGNDVYLGNLSGWSVVGTGDYTGNGVSNIIWQSQSSGATYEWTMSNGQHTGDILLGNLAGWSGK
jgi:hypothetical protein